MTTSSRRHWWLTLVMSGLGGLMLSLFLGPRGSLPVLPRPPQERNMLRIAYPQVLLPDPHRRTFPLPAQNQFVLSLWEPLVECDPATGQAQPAAAAGWVWSPDRLTLTVRLRPDARWSNGDPVTAQDFVRGWRRLLRQPLETAGVLFPIKHAEDYHLGRLQEPAKLGLEAVDDFTLRITLAEVRSTLVAELADPLLSPMHASTEAALKERSYFRHPEALVTNGPFRLSAANAEGYRMVTSDYYHDRERIRLEGAIFTRVDNLQVGRLLVAAGKVDMVAPMPDGGLAGLPTVRRLSEETEMALLVNTLDLNVTRGPLGDLRVRRALALAQDRTGPINRLAPDRMAPAYAWVPDMPGRPGLTLLREDEAEARRLLAEAGYPGGRGFPVLIMPVSPRWRDYPFLQAWTERWYRVLGVRTYLAYEPEAKRVARFSSGDYDVVFNAMIATVPDAGDLLGTFTQPGMLSASRWENKEGARLMTEAGNLTGRERLALLERVERLVMNDVPTIPMMFERRRTLMAAEVGGWYADPLGRQSLKRLYIRTEPSDAPTGKGDL